MVITPTVRGMFGLEWNAGENELTVSPALPAQWNKAKILGVPLGQSRIAVEFRRNGSTLAVRLVGETSRAIKLRSRMGGAKFENGELRIPLPAAEVGIAHGLPEAGAMTSQMKVLDQQTSPHSLRLRLAAPANSYQTLFLRVNDPRIHLRVEGGDVSPDSVQLRMQFPSGAGYVEKNVTLAW
jgi:hypothetical protein